MGIIKQNAYPVYPPSSYHHKPLGHRIAWFVSVVPTSPVTFFLCLARQVISHEMLASGRRAIPVPRSLINSHFSQESSSRRVVLK